MSIPCATRAHAAALMTGEATVLAVRGRKLVTLRADDVLGYVDRILFTRSDVEDAGVEWSHSAGRFSRGSGPLVDEILNDINEHLASEKR